MMLTFGKWKHSHFVNLCIIRTFICLSSAFILFSFLHFPPLRQVRRMVKALNSFDLFFTFFFKIVSACHLEFQTIVSTIVFIFLNIS